jgi:pyruvate carboxylase
VAFPASVIEMLRGDLGQPPGGWPAALQKKALKGEKPINVRPGSLIEPVDLDQAKREIEKKLGRNITDEELASALMYPKVFADFAVVSEKYGPVSVLPTPVFFYGMEPGDEITLEIERGKAIVIRLQTIGATDDDGNVKVFFELNGQPRIVKVPNRAMAGRIVTRRKGEEGNAKHVAAPMPGSVSSIAVAEGQPVKAGDVLLTLEAMKMETAIHAAQDCTIGEIAVKPGAQVDAKDLLIVLA